MSAAQRWNGELDRHAEHHGNDDRSPCNTIGAIPDNAIAARAFIAKTIHRIRGHPSEDERERIECRENRKK